MKLFLQIYQFYHNFLINEILRDKFKLFPSIFFLLLWANLGATEASVIVASIEGEVTSMSIEDELIVTLNSSSVGKKVEEKSIALSNNKEETIVCELE